MGNSGGFSDIEFFLWGLPLLIPSYAQQMGLAILMGLFVGIEREKRGKSASLRTFSVISAGSCLFTILSVQAVGGGEAGPYDLTRISAQIVSGIGFLGGGVIFKTVDRIEGITTAALIWLVAALGMACGFNAVSIALWSFCLMLATHLSVTVLYYLIYRYRGNGKRVDIES